MSDDTDGALLVSEAERAGLEFLTHAGAARLWGSWLNPQWAAIVYAEGEQVSAYLLRTRGPDSQALRDLWQGDLELRRCFPNLDSFECFASDQGSRILRVALGCPGYSLAAGVEGDRDAPQQEGR